MQHHSFAGQQWFESDACGIQSLALNITTFNCANVNGNTVILTVTDVNSNTSTCSATVTIEDNVAPNRALPERDGAIGQYWKRFNHRRRRQQRQLRQLCDCNVGLEPNGIRLLRSWCQHGNLDGDRCQWQFDNMLDDHHGRGQCRASGCLPEHYGATRQHGQCGSTTASAVNNGSSDNLRNSIVGLSQTHSSARSWCQHGNLDRNGCQWQFDDMLAQRHGRRQCRTGGCLPEHYGAA
jgi:hypothetical protein